MTKNDQLTPKDFATINLMCAAWVGQALRAGLVAFVAKAVFYDQKAMFALHPANTMAYSALASLEQQCLVHISEVIQTWIPDMTGSAPIRRTSDVLAHRTAIGHPANFKWKKEWMQKFHDAGRAHLDLRAAIIWDLQRSLNDLARGEQYGEHNTDIPVTGEMAELLHQIFRYSMTDAGRAHLPALPELMAQLVQFKPRYVEMLERHPSGRPEPSEPSGTESPR